MAAFVVSHLLLKRLDPTKKRRLVRKGLVGWLGGLQVEIAGFDPGDASIDPGWARVVPGCTGTVPGCAMVDLGNASVAGSRRGGGGPAPLMCHTY